MVTKKGTVVVLGLGYVGLPLAIEFSKHYQVIGFDVSEKRIGELKSGFDSSKETASEDIVSAIRDGRLSFTNDEGKLRGKNFYIVSVPTPVNERFEPDLYAVKSASEIVGRAICKGAVVVYESTVYPGATEEECIPLVSDISTLLPSEDFYFGYSPERINPGDKKASVRDIVKVTSGCCPYSAKIIDELYGTIVTAGTFSVKSVRVAEACKVFENVQRDVNIALVNEFSILCHSMGINCADVLSGAATKWNFMPFSPGLVGGHCIGVDPYYLIHKANAVGNSLALTAQARKTNEYMPFFIVQKLKDQFLLDSKSTSINNVLIMGYTFKENCPDTRNTKVKVIIDELANVCNRIDVFDPWVSGPDRTRSGLNFVENLSSARYDAIMVTVKHDIFMESEVDLLVKIQNEDPIFFDLKRCYPNIKSHFIL